MKGYELDERQKGSVYKAGYESFFVLIILEIMKDLASSDDIKFFTSLEGNFAILYLGLFYFAIRRATLDCEVPDKKRARNRIVGTISMLVCTVFTIFMLLDGDGLRWIEADKTAGPGFTFSIFFISGWILTIISWIQKRKGFEE